MVLLLSCRWTLQERDCGGRSESAAAHQRWRRPPGASGRSLKPQNEMAWFRLEHRQTWTTFIKALFDYMNHQTGSGSGQGLVLLWPLTDEKFTFLRFFFPTHSDFKLKFSLVFIKNSLSWVSFLCVFGLRICQTLSFSLKVWFWFWFGFGWFLKVFVLDFVQFALWVDAVIFVFSLEDEKSFQAVYHYFNRLASFRNTSDLPLVLVGTQGLTLTHQASLYSNIKGLKLLLSALL